LLLQLLLLRRYHALAPTPRHVEELGGTASLMGLMLFFNCVTEVPAFHFQSVILDRLPVPLVYNGSMLLLALRLAGYGFLPLLHSPWPVLVLELLHGE
jgi:hypothetical protein